MQTNLSLSALSFTTPNDNDNVARTLGDTKTTCHNDILKPHFFVFSPRRSSYHTPLLEIRLLSFMVTLVGESLLFHFFKFISVFDCSLIYIHEKMLLISFLHFCCANTHTHTRTHTHTHTQTHTHTCMSNRDSAMM